MKPLAFLFFFAVVFASCDKDLGSSCPGCTPPSVEDPRSSILLNVHISIPAGLYPAEQSNQFVDQAYLELLDAVTREVVARKQIAVKGNGDVVDGQSVAENSAFLYSSQVKVSAPWDQYIITFHANLQTSLGSEDVIDCTSGSATIRFDY